MAAVIPHSLKKSTFSISPPPTTESLSALIPTYIDRAHHVYSHVYEPTVSFTSHDSAAASLQAFADLKDFLEGDYAADRFAAFDFSGLTASLKDTMGADHEQVHEAHKALREILKDLTKRDDIKPAVVSIPSPHSHSHHHKHGHGHGKRQPQQSPLPLPRPGEPIEAISTCHASADTCGNATDSCSGHGQCVAASKAGKTCFVCACSVTTDLKGRKEHWAGSACERRDVSGCVVCVLLCRCYRCCGVVLMLRWRQAVCPACWDDDHAAPACGWFDCAADGRWRPEAAEHVDGGRGAALKMTSSVPIISVRVMRFSARTFLLLANTPHQIVECSSIRVLCQDDH